MAIYRIYFSENDSRELASRESPKSLVEDVDFGELVVNKPWGYEYLMYRNPFAQLWSLGIRENGITSMHCHPRKKTALIVVEGQAVFSTLDTSICLQANDSVIIDSGVFHSTRAVGAEGARVLEIETPPLKYDLIRLIDEYGRAGTFYEGREKMRVGVVGTVRFPELKYPMREQRQFGSGHLTVLKVARSYSDAELSLLKESALVAVLEGVIYSRRSERLYTVGDVVTHADYRNNLGSHVFSDLTLLLIQ